MGALKDQTKRRVLVVSHEASRTGAPRIAIDVLLALEGFGVPGVERVAVLRWGGPLVHALAEAADRTRYEPFRRVRVALRRLRPTQGLAVALEERSARWVLRRERPDLVWLNTVKSACYIRPAVELGVRVVLHSHELGALCSDTLARYHLDELYGHVRLLACSAAAADTLSAATHGSVVTVVPSAVDVQRVQALAQGLPPRRLEHAQRLVVGACGTADQRKGTDLWLAVARLVYDTLGEHSPLWVWVGHVDGDRYQARARHLGLDEVVLFTGETDNPYPVLSAIDIFTLTSREDAFPIVVLEAMALGTPVVAFEVGGVGEQLNGAGTVVPAGDIEAMAATIISLLGDEPTRRKLGGAGALRVAEHFGITGFHQTVTTITAEELARH